MDTSSIAVVQTDQLYAEIEKIIERILVRQTVKQPDKIYDAKEACALLHCSYVSLWKYETSGRLKSVPRSNPKKKRLFTQAAIEAFLNAKSKTHA
jgi:Helix-turn-helix domain